MAISDEMNELYRGQGTKKVTAGANEVPFLGKELTCISKSTGEQGRMMIEHV
jgi:hypothetical protein